MYQRLSTLTWLIKLSLLMANGVNDDHWSREHGQNSTAQSFVETENMPPSGICNKCEDQNLAGFKRETVRLLCMTLTSRLAGLNDLHPDATVSKWVHLCKSPIYWVTWIWLWQTTVCGPASGSTTPVGPQTIKPSSVTILIESKAGIKL